MGREEGSGMEKKRCDLERKNIINEHLSPIKVKSSQ